ncbi:MAG: hypothetical protein JW787_04000 [Sedimentisphaerales bacterium]|nr:hypothetical protein [Sedimentisphaerales bacterium]
MRKIVFVLIVCMFSISGFAQYEELESVKKFSRDRLEEYKEKIIDNKGLIGSVNFALILQNVLIPSLEQSADDSNAAAGKTINITLKDIPMMTYKNGNYWRALMEQTPRDSSVLYAHAYMHAAFGDIPYSDIYFLLGSINVDENTRKELDGFRKLRDKLYVRLSKEISEGIKLHDEGKYAKAIEIYDKAIAKYPEGALFYYEKGLSNMIASRDTNDLKLKNTALAMYKICREKDPFFWRAYQGDDPNVISQLKIFIEKVSPFYTGEKRDVAAFRAFAEGCEQMELYPFAAHARLKLSLIDPKNEKEHLDKFFELIKKSGFEQADTLKEKFENSKSADKEKPPAPTKEK